MPSYLLRLMFNGSIYAGWQYQPNKITVEGTLRNCLSRLFPGGTLHLHSASRTDTGVHALDLCVMVQVPSSPPIPAHGLYKALNHLLPSSIYIRNIQPVPDDFDVRQVQAKTYCYIINQGPFSPFLAPYCWHVPDKLSLDAIRKASSYFPGEHNFLAFTVDFIRQNRESPIRTILSLEIQKWGDFLSITICGNGFLYRMVRRIIGFLLAVGKGQFAPELAIDLLAKGPIPHIQFDTVPPQGLFLYRTIYPQEPLQLPVFISQLPFLAYTQI